MHTCAAQNYINWIVKLRFLISLPFSHIKKIFVSRVMGDIYPSSKVMRWVSKEWKKNYNKEYCEKLKVKKGRNESEKTLNFYIACENASWREKDGSREEGDEEVVAGSRGKVNQVQEN